jgi:hypothetical protein
MPALTHGGVWVQEGSDIDGEAEWDLSGQAVSLSSDGTIVAIGAHYNSATGSAWSKYGHVRVYEYDSASGWLQLGNDIDGEMYGEQSGWSVSLSADGTVVAIGAKFSGGASGQVKVYEYDLSYGWLQVGDDINGEASCDQSGWSVSLSADGTIVAVGAWWNDGTGVSSGHVRVHAYNPTSLAWEQLGDDIDGEGTTYDYSGYSVSLSDDGTIVAIGAPGNDGNGGQRRNSGHVRVYGYDLYSNNWVQLGNDIDGEGSYDESGHSVSLSADGTVVAIGAPDNNDNDFSGHVRVYEYDSSSLAWEQLGDDIEGECRGDDSGYYVSLSADGTIVAIGAPYNDANGSMSGHVRVFEYDSSSLAWEQIGDDIDGEAADDRSGTSVSLSDDGTIVAIGSSFHDGNGDNRGHVKVFHYGN